MKTLAMPIALTVVVVSAVIALVTLCISGIVWGSDPELPALMVYVTFPATLVAALTITGIGLAAIWTNR